MNGHCTLDPRPKPSETSAAEPPGRAWEGQALVTGPQAADRDGACVPFDFEPPGVMPGARGIASY